MTWFKSPARLCIKSSGDEFFACGVCVVVCDLLQIRLEMLCREVS
jgi:hypothetical protein